MEITLITSNLGKVREFKEYLEPEIKINHEDYAYEELRDDDPEEIAKESASRVCKELNKPIVVEDSGLFIEELNEFPGTCSAYIHKRIGLKGILKLMEHIENRKASYKSAVAYCEPGKEPISFLGEEKGMIANEILGNNGFGHDPIFIPSGETKTYGQIENAEKVKKFRKQAVLKLREFLLK
ncbi:RdgB/HAM1 family non-canonical purine NTP pyrophosphatase [Candidatus Woesearchaeota archaeon]|nr:RdgB/HAM1 family non-canonical purine NTP pyrophosphatase [Candidatus Woesearchaeota archaeon]